MPPLMPEPRDVRLERAWAVESAAERADRITPDLVADLPAEVLQRAVARLYRAAGVVATEIARRKAVQHGA